MAAIRLAMVRTMTVIAMMIIEICLSLKPVSEVAVVAEDEGSESTLGVKGGVSIVGLVSVSGRGREEGRVGMCNNRTMGMTQPIAEL